MSTLLVCSSPDTDSVVLPGATAVTPPVSDHRATFGSADGHCIVRGLTTRFPCPGTITWSVSTSLGPSVTGLGSWIAMSLGCTTTGAVAVSPVELVTCTVPWPADSATIDRKSTRLNSSHSQISYAVFCLKKKTHSNLVVPCVSLTLSKRLLN